MKRISVLFVSLTVALCVVMGTVSAFASYYIDAMINYEDNTLKITGEIDSSVTAAALYIVDSSADIENLNDASKIKIMDGIYIDNGKIDASYAFSYTSDARYAYDSYNACIYISSDCYYEKSFEYLSPAEYLARKQAQILYSLKNASDWRSFMNVFLGINESGEIVNDNLSYINPDMASYYDKLDSNYKKNNVFSRMYLKRANLLVFSDIKNSFLAESKYVYENPTNQQGTVQNPQGGNTTGGFGGGTPVLSTDGAGTIPDITNGFYDMKGHWAEGYVTRLSNMKIVAGYPDGTYKPENNVTRAEFVKLVVGAFSLSAEGSVSFGDVYTTDWYKPYIDIAATLGVVNGADGMFKPNDYITRQDASLILYRALSLKFEIPDGAVFFSDEVDVAEYASMAIRSMAAQKIITGYADGSFGPKENTSRAQAATLISRALDYSSAH
ncbi:MAG: S-layer homology domain-containing protein [Clostridia bacterium]|nr:S-layer homology domain-containing protein [Clostridia bacterium]